MSIETLNNRWGIEIIKVINKVTKKVTYYKHICYGRVRISEKNYNDIRDNCDGISSLFDESTNKVNRKFTTCIFYVNKG